MVATVALFVCTGAVWAIVRFLATNEVSAVAYIAAEVAVPLYLGLFLWFWWRQIKRSERTEEMFDNLSANFERMKQTTQMTQIEFSTGPPIGFEEWLEEQPQAVKTAAKSCPPGLYKKDGEVGMVMGYRQDKDDGKVYVAFSVPSLKQEECHINQLTPVEEDDRSED